MKEQDMSGVPGNNGCCEEIECLLVLFACNELEASERATVEAHVGSCTACAALLAGALRLPQRIAAGGQAAGRVDPSDLLLAQCRSELKEALDDAEAASARRGWLGGFRWAHWLLGAFARHPAWGAALLVLFGAALGSVAPQWYRAQANRAGPRPAMTVSVSPRLSEHDLQTMGIAGINWAPNGPSGAPSVELHLTSEKPMVLQGNLDDTEVKRVLTYVVQNGQRFDSGVRLDSVDMLRMRLSDADVRRALCAAARKDSNPGVRLRALEALRGFEQDDLVRQAVLDALENDSNPGVRVEAINSLVGTLRALEDKGPEDPRVVSILRERMQNDPNNYVRMQSAAAIRRLGPRETY